ncbi:hypothetical protein BDV23DRAFT_151691 [Aspergillus alliaceus]|uniref:Uncharacterized protein n=1 Tax=Petromyces alliaceus TaxID=209559 RepID=A0A5N7CDZ5_PETAA|nr:hypothetical protein BDV23DRAFT_151691 [Aspergillus alliaceus]
MIGVLGPIVYKKFVFFLSHGKYADVQASRVQDPYNTQHMYIVVLDSNHQHRPTTNLSGPTIPGNMKLLYQGNRILPQRHLSIARTG